MYLASKQIYALKLCSLPVIFAGIDLYCLLCEFHSSLVQPLICSSFSSQHRGYVLSGLNSHCNAAIQTFIKKTVIKNPDTGKRDAPQQHFIYAHSWRCHALQLHILQATKCSMLFCIGMDSVVVLCTQFVQKSRSISNSATR